MAREKTKSVQIEYDLFWKIMLYFFADDIDSYDYIRTNLEKKLEKMVLHDLYTKSKTAPTDEEKEKARQEYLNKVGVPQSFRW